MPQCRLVKPRQVRYQLRRSGMFIAAPAKIRASPSGARYDGCSAKLSRNYSVGTAELNRRGAKNAEKTSLKPGPAGQLNGDWLGSTQTDAFLCVLRVSAVCWEVLTAWIRLRLGNAASNSALAAIAQPKVSVSKNQESGKQRALAVGVAFK